MRRDGEEKSFQIKYLKLKFSLERISHLNTVQNSAPSHLTSILRGSLISRETKRHRFDPWVGKIPWRRAQQPTAVFLPGESHGQRSPQGRKELDMTEATQHTIVHSVIRCPALPWPGGEHANQGRSWPHSLWNLNLQQNDTETENGRSSCIPPLPKLFCLGAKMSWFQLTSKPNSPVLLSFLFVLRSHYHSKNSLLHKQ